MEFISLRWYNTSGFSSYRHNSLHYCFDASFESIFVKLADFVEGLELERLTG